MDLKATIASSYRNRLILIALGAMLYAAWCLYDAIEAYPNKQAARARFESVKFENPDDWNKQWEIVAAENGWDGTKEPEEVSDFNILTQWLQFGIVFPIGTYCLFSLVLWSRRYVGADADKLYLSGGIEVPFDKVTQIDANRWETKGIAYVNYDLGQGEKGAVIDDWKYEREPSGQIFDRLREHVDADKVIGLSDSDAQASAAEPA